MWSQWYRMAPGKSNSHILLNLLLRLEGVTPEISKVANSLLHYFLLFHHLLPQMMKQHLHSKMYGGKNSKNSGHTNNKNGPRGGENLKVSRRIMVPA